ncbi:MAG: hypothetical protein QOD92_1815 [Acidimicrobiaceae bacterium]
MNEDRNVPLASTARELRVSILALSVMVLVFVLGTAAIPTHVSFAAGSLRCGTVLRPERASEIAPFCGAAGHHQLWYTVRTCALLTAFALVPLGLRVVGVRAGRGVSAAFLSGFVVVAVFGTVLIGFVDYSPPLFFDR